MKPTTKRHVRIFDLAQENCHRLTAEQKAWALTHCLTHEANRTKKDTSCLDCGYIWTGEQAKKACTCPKCGTKLKITDTREKVKAQREFFCMVTVVEEFQVIRHWEVRSYHKAGQERKADAMEVAQIWLEDNGKVELIACNRGGMGGHDCFHGQLEIRRMVETYYGGWENKYDLYPTKTYPKIKVKPLYTRNGFKGNFGESTPYELFRAIVTNTKAETLLKANQHSLLGACTGRLSSKVNQYWASIKICLRNGYMVKNAKDYLDYLDMARGLRMDINNALYACPADLHKAHQQVLAKTQAIQRRRDEERRQADTLRQAAEAEARRIMIENAPRQYVEDKGAYFDLVFSDKKFAITVLRSVDEFKSEGETLNHCVYTRDYYNTKNSLILSARIDGKPIETIEIDLVKMKIVQVRGWDNLPTEHHEQIMKLMNKNLHHVRKVYNQIHTPNRQVAA